MLLSHDEIGILLLSLRVSLLSMALLSVPGILLGWLLARRNFLGKGLIDLLVHLPLVLPPVLTGYLLLLLLGRHGPVGSLLDRWFGLRIAFTATGAAIAAAVMALPLMVRAVRLAIELIDRHIEDAASTLGASPLRVFVTITVPLAAPGILAGMVLSFARSLGEFGATMALAGNIPGQSRTLSVAIYTYTQVPDGDATVLHLALMSLGLAVLALLGSHWLARRMSAGVSR